jgi:hypothetical protein
MTGEARKDEAMDESDGRLMRATVQRRMETITIALGEGIAAAGDADAFLGEMPIRYVRLLLEHLPTLAGPWRVVDMRRGEATRMERIGWGGEPIAVVKRRGASSWSAFVGNALIEAPSSDESGSINWPTCDAARAACDEHMAREGVLLDDARSL